ncbi:hypothetical protein KI387_036504 [Taxus chinensis]|uniref:Phosphate transporter PHO1 n=1 Tax=Taxus chinensis TaxID=29808 RepID=A0AA38FU29_TAXCH|nr:hypothetical protein KI387_036504 [Taxus chinensis]
MVKFSKQLEAELIPEWKGAFLNYWELKKDIKKMKLNCNNIKPPANEKGSLLSVFAYFNRGRGRGSPATNPPHLIQVRERGEDVYETELMQGPLLEDAEGFFSRLDGQLSKVNQFYRSKEAEFLQRGDTLIQQLHILKSIRSLRSMTTASSGTSEEEEVEVECSVDSSPPSKKEKAKGGRGRGRKVRVDIPATTPSRTISAITQELITQSNKKINAASAPMNKKKILTAEKIIRGAFVDLYRGLGLLKTYSCLNMVAFGKILKKFDKVCDKQVAPLYLKAVERSYFNTSDKVVKLADEVESLFIEYFTEDDRKKAMKFLRPKQKQDCHTVTFFIGLFTGCFLALFVGYAILAHLSGIYTDPTHSGYIETVYPVFSMLALLNLHIFLYGCNIFMWRSARINYSFIFEFSPNSEVKYRDVFLMCSTLMTLLVGAMVAHLTLRANAGFSFSPLHVDVIPAFLLLLFISLLFCPLDIVYRSTRFCFLKVMRNIMFAPLYKVVMTDFFMADQLTSQVTLLRHLEFVACYYIGGSFRSSDDNGTAACTHNKLYREMAYVVSFLPYYWRALQCARRWVEEGDANHVANLGKYVSAILAAGTRLTYAMQPNNNNWWLLLVVLTSTIATVYQLYWDFVKDWGLLNPHSKNPWLRDELLLKHKIIYFLSMAFNFLLRLAWVQSIMHLNLGRFGYRITDFVLASLEVIRRGHWNFYRLENEHLNNVGKYRAVKSVPLPFRELDEHS